MTAIPSGQIIEKISRFAREHIAPRSDLSSTGDFPHDLWGKMAQERLFKIGIDEFYGGNGGGYRDLNTSAEALVQFGFNMGLGISWLYQQLVARFLVAGFGSVDQKRQYLPEMVRGELTASFAVSEPKRGAHPKLLTTAAIKDKSFYTLSGEKTYLTNGPIADIFIVIAITGYSGERKEYTAFLVPHNTAGLKVSRSLNLNFFRPAPHGGIIMDNCHLPQTAILGKAGTAYRDMVIPFGRLEDIVMLGTATGGMAAQLAMLINFIGNDNITDAKSLDSKLTYLDASIRKLRKAAFTELEKLDQDAGYAVSHVINFINPVSQFLSDIKGIVDQCNLKTGAAFEYLQADLQAMLEIKKKKTGVAVGKGMK
jgi:alkylation response protein AidB-like acyl-CoA dehydrogenase